MARANHRRSPPRLRVATHLAPSVLPAYALAARRMGEKLDRPAELVVAADYQRCAADVDHVCFVCSIPYLLLSAEGRIQMEPIAAPILRGRRYGGRPVYFSDIIVRADRPWRSLEELDGRRWAFNEPYSHSGFMVVLYALAERGATPAFIRGAVEAGFHDDAIRMVVDGHADWAAIDTQVVDLAVRLEPRLRTQLRVIDTLGPSTIQPVVASARRLSGAQRSAVRDALLAMDSEPSDRRVLRAAGIDRFVAITDDAYDDIRAMFEAVQGAGLLPAWWWTRWRELTAPPDRSYAASTIGLTSPIQRSSVSSS
jgi:phosphonate transport system substrate-binding protein